MPAPVVTNKLVNSDSDTDDEFPSLEAIIKSPREAKQARQVDAIDMTGDAEHCALCPKELRFGLDVFLFPACLCVSESSPQQDIDGNGYRLLGSAVSRGTGVRFAQSRIIEAMAVRLRLGFSISSTQYAEKV